MLKFRQTKVAKEEFYDVEILSKVAKEEFYDAKNQ